MIINKFNSILKKYHIGNYSFYLFIFLIICSFFITFIILLPNSELLKDQYNLLLLLSIDTILVIILLGIIIRQIVLILVNRKKNYSASKLHIRFINLFTIISLVPTIGLVIVAALFFNLELRTWYGEAVKSTIINSNIVANDYLKQKKEILETNTQSIAREIFNYGIKEKLTENDLKKIINENYKIKKLDDIYIFNSLNKIITFANNKNSTDTFKPPNKEILEELEKGKIYTIQKNNNTVSAYYKLRFLKNTYILINDDINETIYNHLFETAKAITTYNSSEENALGLQITFSMIFVLFALSLLLISILLGFRMAGRLSQPIINLINSSKKISKGNFDAKVNLTNDSDEISLLLESFNKMIVEIENQQKELIEKNVEIENRRLFNEAVLASLSTGVIALDKNYKIKLINKSLKSIISFEKDNIIGSDFFKVFLNLGTIKSNLENGIYNNLSQQIEYNHKNNIRNLFIKFTLEKKEDSIIGYVVTIDDLTSLILAEKHAAWSDIARKIAHEVKNPLTPIKLSAERIEKKLNENEINKDTFISLVKTISKQVDDIGKLIDEFSSFARLPKAEIKKDEFSSILKECYDFYSNAHSNINFKFDNNCGKIYCFFDRFQISLVLNNITKNAIEAVSKIKNSNITFKLRKNNKYLNMNIIDNGEGVDMNNINKIFKPYYTTKEKGTGLGLSICKKIVEDHGGNIFIKKNASAGSTVTLSLAL